MKLLVDTNILIDCMEERSPFDKGARKLFLLGVLGEADLWMSPSQITDAFYLISDGGKRSLAAMAKARLKEMKRAVRICTFGEYDVDAALDLPWDDFEDAYVYQCARKLKVDAIITRNKRDFAASRIPVFDCDEFFAYLKEEKGLVYDEIDMAIDPAQE